MKTERYGDWNAKGRQLTEETDRNGAPYYEKVQELLRAHEEKKQDLLRSNMSSHGSEKIHHSLMEGEKKAKYTIDYSSYGGAPRWWLKLGKKYIKHAGWSINDAKKVLFRANKKNMV